MKKAITIIAMTLPFVGSFLYFVIYTQSIYAKLIYSSVKVFTLVFPFLVYKLLKNPTKLPRFTLKMCWNSTKEGLIVGILMFTVIILFWQFFYFEKSFESKDLILEKVNSLGIKESFILFAIFISFFHSLIEEYYWRWFVFGSLKESFNISALSANVLSALAFTSHHVVVLSQYFETIWVMFFSLCVFGAGVIWNFIYEKRKGLLSAWLSHIFADIAIMWIGYIIINS